MDTDAAFEEIRGLISSGNYPDAVAKTLELSGNDSDAITRIKCLSLLKVVGDKDASKQILKDLMDALPEDRETLIQVAGALRGLDFPSNSYSILKKLDQDDTVRRLSCMCLEDMEEYESALEVAMSIENKLPVDRIMLSEIHGFLGERAQCLDIAKELLDEFPKDFDVRRTYVSALIISGKDGEASKFVRGCLKEKSAASNALAAYVMRITGKTKAAAGYATRAIQMDQRNVSALETLGICLAEKGEFEKARIVAGAINEVSPGNRAALNVLSYCE